MKMPLSCIYLSFSSSPDHKSLRKRNLAVRSAAIGMAALLQGHALHAAAFTWVGGTGNWLESSDWSGSSVAFPQTGDTAVFNSLGNSSLSVSLSGGTPAATNLVFDSVNTGAYIIGSSADNLSLDNSGSITIKSPVTNTDTV